MDSSFRYESDNIIDTILNQADSGKFLWVNTSNATINNVSNTIPTTPAIPAPPISFPSWELGRILQYDDHSENYSVVVYTVDQMGCYQQENAAPIK